MPSSLRASVGRNSSRGRAPLKHTQIASRTRGDALDTIQTGSVPGSAESIGRRHHGQHVLLLDPSQALRRDTSRVG